MARNIGADGPTPSSGFVEYDTGGKGCSSRTCKGTRRNRSRCAQFRSNSRNRCEGRTALGNGEKTSRKSSVDDTETSFSAFEPKSKACTGEGANKSVVKKAGDRTKIVNGGDAALSVAELEIYDGTAG